VNLMTCSIRIGVPTATDPTGAGGPGYWWITGHARPGLIPERTRRPRGLRRRSINRRMRRMNSCGKWSSV
jgi:hypothetical protein